MKFGQNFKTGMRHFLSSWNKHDDPSYGDFTLEVTKYSEPIIRKVHTIYFRGGLWDGVKNSGIPDSDLKDNSLFTVEVVSNEEEMYYVYQLINQSILYSIVLLADGRIERLTWVNTTSSWTLLLVPRDLCDHYALCGTYSTCDATKVNVCPCLKKFKPKSPEYWDTADWSHGCECEVSLNCSKGEGFTKLTGVKLADTTDALLNKSMNLKECREKCLENCSCVAYAKRDTGGDAGGLSLNCSKGEGFTKLSGVKLADTTDALLNKSLNLKECREKCLENCSCVAYAKRDTGGDAGGLC